MSPSPSESLGALEAGHFAKEKPKQRPVHRAFMILASLLAIGGYIAVFLAHAACLKSCLEVFSPLNG